MNKNTMGIWCRKDNKFYYLESGEHVTLNPLNRIRSVLLRRELIDLTNLNNDPLEPSYKAMRVAEATERGYELVPIFLNQHVKKQVEEKVKQEQGSPWE